MNDFLGDYHERLVKDDLMRPGPTETDIADALFEVLAEFPFSATVLNPYRGENEPGYDYAAVVAETRKRMASKE